MIREYTKAAKELRSRHTKVENILWHELRAGRFAGHKFRRQQIIKPYIVDFVCLEKGLIIELDGNHHKDALHEQYDIKRSHFLNILGYHVIRFNNSDIYSHSHQVLQKILFELETMHY